MGGYAQIGHNPKEEHNEKIVMTHGATTATAEIFLADV